jgi:hypothetical protein
MGATSKFLPQIVNQRSYVGPGRARHLERTAGRIPRKQLQAIDVYGSGLTLHFNAMASQAIERLAPTLDRRVHGGDLLDGSTESLQGVLDGTATHVDRLLAEDLTFRVECVRDGPQPGFGSIGLRLAHQILGHTRR